MKRPGSFLFILFFGIDFQELLNALIRAPKKVFCISEHISAGIYSLVTSNRPPPPPPPAPPTHALIRPPPPPQLFGEKPEKVSRCHVREILIEMCKQCFSYERRR